MQWKRLFPPVWFTQYLAAFSLFFAGSAVLGLKAVEGDTTAGACLVVIWGLVWAYLAATAKARQGGGAHA